VILKLKPLSKKLKLLLVFIITISSGLVYASRGFYLDYNNYGNKENFLFNMEDSLKTSFTLSHHENFESLTYVNESITNTTGWGKGGLHLSFQKIVNASNFNYDLDKIKSMDFFEDLLFIADNSKGLKILNVSNPWNPFIVNRFGDTYNLTSDIKIQGSYAFIADGMDGLEILDISNPLNPQKINSWSIGKNITNVHVFNNFIFLSVQDLGIEIINITNLFSLTEVGNWTNYQTPSGAYVKGDNLIIAYENNGVEIIDISNFNNLYKKSEIPISGTIFQFQIKNDFLYVANGIEGLKIIDIQDWSNPTIVSTFHKEGIVKSLVIDENYGFLACDGYGISTIDISNPLNPLSVANWTEDPKAYLIKNHNGFHFLGCDTHGLKILKYSEIITPRKISDYSLNINAYEVLLDGDIAYLCSVEDGIYNGGLTILDISDPFNPQTLGSFNTSGYDFYDVKINDKICYAASKTKGFLSLNITDLENISILDSIGGYLLNSSTKVELYNDLAFVSNGPVGLDIYNISNPKELVFLKNYPLSSGICYDVKIRNNYAFLAKGYQGIEILNISNLNSIKSVSVYGDTYNNSQSIAFYGNYLLVADRFDGVEILDISDLSNPQKIAYYNDSYSRTVDIQVVDNLAIVSDIKDGIEILNITDPSNPFEIDSFTDDYNQTLGCAASSRFIYIADSHDGLQIVQYKECLFNQYKESAIAQSLSVDYTYATITNATMIISAEIPINTSLEYYISNDNGKHWDSVLNNTFHQFSVNGSDLIWKILLSTTMDLYTPKIFNVYISYSASNTQPSILEVPELQNLEIWNQLEDFGTFELNLSSYKSDNEFETKYLNWTFLNVNYSLFSVVMDENDKDIFNFYSIENMYGSDEFDLYLNDPGGKNSSIIINLTIEPVNDVPYFLENNISITNDVANNLIRIEYDAIDIDNDQDDLKYSIYYGDGTSWNVIVANYEEKVHMWNTQGIPEGDYYIRLVVSDGSNETIWISSTKYLIRDPFLKILVLVIKNMAKEKLLFNSTYSF